MRGRAGVVFTFDLLDRAAFGSPRRGNKFDKCFASLECVPFLITNFVEEIFFLLSKLEADFSPRSREKVIRLSTS